MRDIYCNHIDTCTQSELNIKLRNKNLWANEILVAIDFGQSLEKAVTQGTDFVCNKNLFLDEYDVSRELRETLKEIDLSEFDKSDVKIWVNILWN